MTATIEIVEKPTTELVEALARLLPQLSSAPTPDSTALETIMAGGSTVFVAPAFIGGRVLTYLGGFPTAGLN